MTSAVEMSITELRRTGDGSYDDTPTVFRFTGPEHSSAQGVLELHLKANHVRKEIPGGNQVVHQMLAATWQPFTLEGEWDDKWGNRRYSAVSGFQRTGSYAFHMYQSFAEMVKQMPTVRLEIDALSLVGVLTDLKLKYHHRGKIGWVVTMSPETNENLTVEARRPTVSKSIPKWLDEIAVVGTQLNESFAVAATLPMKSPRVDSLTSSLLEINDSLDRLSSFGIASLDGDVTNKLLLIAATFRRIRAASFQMAMDVSTITSSIDIAYDDVVVAMTHANWIAASHTWSMQMVGLSRLAEKDMKKRAGKKPRAIYYPKKNESLERIAARFYGSADAWRTIYDANNLDSLVLDGTEELIIPERRS